MFSKAIILETDLESGESGMHSFHSDVEQARAALWNMAHAYADPEHKPYDPDAYKDYEEVTMKDGILYSHSVLRVKGINEVFPFKRSYRVLDLSNLA